MKCIILTTCLVFAQVVLYSKSAAKVVQTDAKPVQLVIKSAQPDGNQGAASVNPGIENATPGTANAKQYIENVESAKADGNAAASSNLNDNSTGPEAQNAPTGNKTFLANMKLSNGKMIEKAKSFIALILRKVHHYTTKVFSLFDIFSKKYLDSGLAKVQKLSEESKSTGEFFNKCAIEFYNSGLRIIEKFEKIALPTFDRLITEIGKIGESKTLNEFVVKAGVALADVVA